MIRCEIIVPEPRVLGEPFTDPPRWNLKSRGKLVLYSGAPRVGDHIVVRSDHSKDHKVAVYLVMRVVWIDDEYVDMQLHVDTNYDFNVSPVTEMPE